MLYSTLLTALDNLNGASFIGLDTTTVPALTGGKKNYMKGNVRKHIVGSTVMVFQNKRINGYDAMVRRRLEQEGKDATSFVLGPRIWGTRLPDLPIVEHDPGGHGNIEHYLEVIFLRAGEVSYTHNGMPIAEADILGLPEKKDDPDGQGGLDNKVIIRTFNVRSIDEIRVNGFRYF